MIMLKAAVAVLSASTMVFAPAMFNVTIQDIKKPNQQSNQHRGTTKGRNTFCNGWDKFRGIILRSDASL
jgi:hypothetical protein